MVNLKSALGNTTPKDKSYRPANAFHEQPVTQINRLMHSINNSDEPLKVIALLISSYAMPLTY